MSPEPSVMPGDTRNFENLLTQVLDELGELKKFIFLHTQKIENIEPLDRRVRSIETKIAVIETQLKEQPKNRDYFQIIGWLAMFVLISYSTFFK